MARVITYECTQCGSEIVVNENLEAALSPIYCCGFAVTETSSKEGKPAKKKTAKKAAGKVAKKKVSKKPAPKKATGKSSKKK